MFSSTVVHLVFDAPTYEVSEAIGEPSSHLALLVCVVQNASLARVEGSNSVEIVISTEEKTARGTYMHVRTYVSECTQDWGYPFLRKEGGLVLLPAEKWLVHETRLPGPLAICCAC